MMKNTWDLTPLYKSDTDPNIKKDRKKTEKFVNEFAKKWKKDNKYLSSPTVLKQALDEYEKLNKLVKEGTKDLYYFFLRTSQNENNAKLKAEFRKANEFSVNLQNKLQFFELSISKVELGLQKKLIRSPELVQYKHFLEKLFIQAQYLLSEPEEKIMNLKASSSHSSWVKMLSGFLSKEERNVYGEDGKSKNRNFSEIIGLISSRDIKVRNSSTNAFNDILNNNLDVAENELNAVLHNKKVNDQLRKFKRPDAARHIQDDIETKVVDSLVKNVTKSFEIAQKYYQLKAKLLGVERLKYHERNVPYGELNEKFSFQQGRKLLVQVMEELDNDFRDISGNLLNSRKVDVYPRKGKRMGGFCANGLLSHPTYILVNWNDKLDDVLTLAHEIGHGIHFELSRKNQNSLNFEVTLASTEVASTFMEDFVLQELLNQVDDETKLSLLMSKLNDDISTIFRQIAFYNFELELHSKFRKTGYLSKQEIGNLFTKHMKTYMGKYVEQSKGSENWWVYVGHFRTFFYVYSYASGLLISKSLQNKVKNDPKFILKVKRFLSAGSSQSPAQIFKGLGIDITCDVFWNEGVQEVKSLLSETESLAKKLGKI